MSLFGDVTGFIDTGRAANSISDSNIAAEHGVLGATGDGQTDIQQTIAGNGNNLQPQLNGNIDAVGNAGQNLTDAANGANSTVAGLYNTTQSNLASGVQSGNQGNQSLQAYAASNPTFTAPTTAQVEATPGYQFQLQQGTNAITNSAAAQGLSQSGGTDAALMQYGQGLAGTYYQNAFNNAQSAFNTNQNATLGNLNSLINAGNTANSTATANSDFTGAQMSSNSTGSATSNLQAQGNLANTNTNAVTTNNGQNLQGAETSAGLGLAGATTAGNFATAAGTAHAAGITGQGAALTSGVSDLAGLYTNLMGGG